MLGVVGQSDPPAVQAGIEDRDLTGTRVLVTGSTSGIGRAAALALGDLGATVIVHGRDTSAGETVVADIERAGGTATFIRADLQDPEAVSRLADDVRETVDELDVLCNNAGGFFRDREPTSLGVDRAFHINHLAHYQVTAELLNVLGSEARVVTTASLGHRGATLDLDRLLDLSGLSPVAAYFRSKLANIQFALELARRLDTAGRDITSNAFHPGIIPGSEFGRTLPDMLWGPTELLAATPVGETVADGAATLVYLAASAEVAGVTGGYFARQHQIRPSGTARDPAARADLWQRSAELLDIEPPLDDQQEPT